VVRRLRVEPVSERFCSYIQGGATPSGSTRPSPYPGCRLKADPLDARSYSLPYRLYFARHSTIWHDGGVAFVGDPAPVDRPTLARIFLLRTQQLEDVVAQENSAKPGDIELDIGDTVRVGYQDVRNTGWYRRVLHCGDIEDLPVLTCTAAEGQAEVRAVAPSIEYLRWVVVGLHESWKLSPTKIAEYLIEAPGISLSYHSTAELEEAVRRSLEAA